MRHPTFPPLDAVADRVPSAAQEDAARALVSAWALPPADIGPGVLANPARARELLVAARALAGGGVEVPGWDETAPGAALVPAPRSHDAAAAEAAFGTAFAVTRPAEGEGPGLEKARAKGGGRGRGRGRGARQVGWGEKKWACFLCVCLRVCAKLKACAKEPRCTQEPRLGAHGRPRGGAKCLFVLRFFRRCLPPLPAPPPHPFPLAKKESP